MIRVFIAADRWSLAAALAVLPPRADVERRLCHVDRQPTGIGLRLVLASMIGFALALLLNVLLFVIRGPKRPLSSTKPARKGRRRCSPT